MSRPPGSDDDAPRDARLLIVGGGPFQVDMIRVAKRLVREVWVVDRDEGAPGMALADHAVAVDFGRPELVVELAQKERFDGVTTAASDAAVQAMAGCVHALGLVGIDEVTARRCRDKLETAQALERAGLLTPSTRLVIDADSAPDAAASLGGYPVVVKPRSGAGGRGVSIVRGPTELAAAIAKVQRYAQPDGGFLLQEWIDGHSVGVEAFLWQGRLAAGFCLSDQYTEGFVSPIGHGLPCDLDDSAQARVLRSVEAFCRALGASAGPFNFDLRDTGRGVCLIEANPRLGGNSITPLVRAAYGVDLAAATVLAALGEDPSQRLRRSAEAQACAARLIAVRGAGSGAVIRQSKAVWERHPDVLELELVTRDGRAVALRVDDWALLGRCLVKGASAAAAIELARNVTDDVQGGVTLIPPPP